jgi:riboflavin synthase
LHLIYLITLNIRENQSNQVQKKISGGILDSKLYLLGRCSMFTGIVEEIGKVDSVTATPTGRRITIYSKIVTAGTAPGASIAVNGVCLTIIKCSPATQASQRGKLTADILQKTWDVTNLHALKPGDGVNLERALRLGDRVGGHFVLGHVDGRGTVMSHRREGSDLVVGISAGKALMGGIVLKGSIAVDGVSLTVAEMDGGAFYVHLVPFTIWNTTLGNAPVGSPVNLELDILGKHARQNQGKEITESLLREHGFM